MLLSNLIHYRMMMKARIDTMKIIKNPQKITQIIILVIILTRLDIVYCTTTCDYGTKVGNKLYSYSLASPTKFYPHGVLSEDGFYKVAANDTIIWFQLCDVLIFNHDPPRCIDCSDCGGPSRCGMGCSALVAEKIGGYSVCTTIGRDLNFKIDLTDKKTPKMGVTVTMSSKANGVNCSLSVSIICDSNGVKEPETFEKSGTCNYATVLRHPSGCSKIGGHVGGWGWFSVLLTILLCCLGTYLVGGAVYRFFFLKIHGLDAIPNLDFWTSIPHRTKMLFISVVQRFRGPTHHHTSSYSSVNF
ncbi:uncharacterized protein LOC141604802 [Silene latifolia]|uniref:uncharacterized protein LOC141604802 n=1 Tax=Silene latifolia TaxID=37657 RepID=UPI003D782733